MPHNGGLSQINLSFMMTGGQFPFINCFLANQGWGRVGGGLVTVAEFDSNGYPTTIVGGGVTTRFYVPTQTERPGDYICCWTSSSAGTTNATVAGKGTLNASGTGLKTFTITAAEMAAVTNQVDLSISAVGASDLHFYHSDDAAARAAAILAGQTWGGFGVKFKEILTALKPGVIRFLNWQGNPFTGANSSNATVWANRVPTTYYSFSGEHFLAALDCGDTAGSGDTFTITGNGLGVPATGGPVDKMQIQLNLDHAGSTTANALSLNGTTAVPFFSSQTSAATTIQSSRKTITYDSSLNAWLAIGSSGSHVGCPPEVMMALCYEIGAHPWFVTPYLAFDPLTDYMSSLATYHKTTYIDGGLATWMKLLIEGTNETWNDFTNFYVGTYSLKKATAYWGGANIANYDDYWYGYALSNLGQQINAIYGGDPKTQTAYELICGVKSSDYLVASTHNPRLNSVRAASSITATFSNGSANVVVTGNTYAVDAPIQFRTAGTLPTNFAVDTTYYVKTTGNTITVSATTPSSGGAAIVAGSAGSGTHKAIPATQSPAYNWATAVCCTGYWKPLPNFIPEEEVLQGFEYFITNDGNAAAQLVNLNDYADDNGVTYSRFNGTIASNVLTVNSISFAPRGVRSTLSTTRRLVYDGCPQGVMITSQSTGTAGDVGTYALSGSPPDIGPVPMKQTGSGASYQALAAWGRSFSNPVSKIFVYESGWDPEPVSATSGEVTIQVLSATNANPCVLTVKANSSGYYIDEAGSPSSATDATGTNFLPPIGGWLSVRFSGAWAGLLGTYKVSARSGNTITIELDASGQGAGFATQVTALYRWLFNTGTISITGDVLTVASHAGDPIMVGTSFFYSGAPSAGGYPQVSALDGTGTGGNGTYRLSTSPGNVSGLAGFGRVWPFVAVNALRLAAKDAASLVTYTTENYDYLVKFTDGGEWPSCFDLSGQSVWGVYEPNIYVDEPPQATGIRLFNSRLRRKTLIATP